MKKIFGKDSSSKTKFAINLALMEATFWFAWSFSGYSGVYLQGLGFQPSTVGQINAIGSGVVIFSTIFFGMLSDKINSIKKVLLSTTLVGFAMYAIVPLLPTDQNYSFMLLFCYYPLINLVRGVTGTLLDNIAVRTSSIHKINFGLIRCCGSLMFATGSLVVVWSTSMWGIESAFYLSGILVIPAIVCMFYSYDPKIKLEKEKKNKVSLKPLLKNYFFMTFLVAMAIVQFAFVADHAFMSYLFEEIGIPKESYPTLLAIRAFAEVPCLFFSVKLRSKFKLKYLIMFAISLMGLEAVLMGLFAQDLMFIILVTTLFGLGNGIFLGSLGFYLFKLAPDNLKASAQSLYGAVASIAGIGGNFIGGMLYEVMGGRVFYVFNGGMFLLGVLIFVVTLYLGKKHTNPADEKN